MDLLTIEEAHTDVDRVACVMTVMYFVSTIGVTSLVVWFVFSKSPKLVKMKE